jgi:hypothetical protein
MRIGGGRCDRGLVVGIVVGAGQLLSEEKLPTRRAICGATDPSSASSPTASSAVADQAEISPERPLVVAGVRGRLPTPDG